MLVVLRATLLPFEHYEIILQTAINLGNFFIFSQIKEIQFKLNGFQTNNS
jgi:hypothetical protein